VRVHDAELVRVEVEADEVERLARPEIRAQVVAGLTALGWRYVTLDLEGFRSGSMNPRTDESPT
jgi:pyridinium-3,5-biscarboxylic acid mononucleotide sulfurtransferase